MAFRKNFKRSRNASKRRRSFTKRSSFKRKRQTMARPKLVAKVKKNTTKLARVAKIVDNTTGTHFRRQMFTSTMGCLYGQTQVLDFTSLNLNEVETAIDSLEYYNPANPGTLTIANGNTGEYQREFLITKATSNLHLQNQGYVPMTVKIYECRPKTDTNFHPSEIWEQGLQNQQVDVPLAGAELSLVTRPSDVILFKDMWGTSNYKEVRLMPGASVTSTAQTPGFTFDPSLVDTHQPTFAKRYGAMVWMVVLVGDITPDATLTYVSTSNAANLVVTRTETIEVKYDAGVSVNTLEYKVPAHLTGVTAYNTQRPTVNRQDATGDIEGF